MYFLVTFVLVFGLEPKQVVDRLNQEYSKISGNSKSLFGLLQTVSWKDLGDRGVMQGSLLLNNTYKGIALHEFQALEDEGEVSIIHHSVPPSEPDPLGIECIEKALLDYLKVLEIQLDSLEVTKMNTSESILYSATVETNNFEYFVDVLIQNDTNFEYVSKSPILIIPKVVIKENLKISGIIISAILGFVLTFMGLCLYNKRYSGLPFIKLPDMRVFSDEKIT